MLPFLLFVLFMALDFGRVFLGWVSLNNSARIAANFAAENPTAWNPLNPETAAQAQYQQLVVNDAGTINCALPSPVPAPTFPDGTEIGDPAKVTITCNFQLLTPLISNVVGNPLAVTASAAFPVRAGGIEGIPVQTAAPTATPTPTPVPTPTSTASPTATPVPMCTVPNLNNVQTSQADKAWTNANFTTSVLYSPQVPPAYKISSQSIAAGTLAQCDTTVITVYP